ncbi:MAG: hypothetical protein OEZ54_06275 [Gemmatimonadota bacterium]|nr:hypothetical protein [Gemmatimonadota bacterium]
MRVQQENVSENFTMLLPLFFDFGADGYARMKYWIEGPETIIELPNLPRRPDNIEFNTLESVLAEVDYVRW